MAHFEVPSSRYLPDPRALVWFRDPGKRFVPDFDSLGLRKPGMAFIVSVSGSWVAH